MNFFFIILEEKIRNEIEKVFEKKTTRAKNICLIGFELNFKSANSCYHIIPILFILESLISRYSTRKWHLKETKLKYLFLLKNFSSYGEISWFFFSLHSTGLFSCFDRTIIHHYNFKFRTSDTSSPQLLTMLYENCYMQAVLADCNENCLKKLIKCT